MDTSTLQTDHLSKKLSQPLPGKLAHQNMWVPGRGDYPTVPTDAKKAAVLIFIYPRLDKTFISFIKRVQHPGDRHGGQISFPGGKVEHTDDFPIQTALREANEEIGVPLTVEVLGKLSPLYIPVSGFIVHPVIAFHHESIPFHMHPDEVDEILEIEVDHLFHADSKSRTDVYTPSGVIIQDVPCYIVNGTMIWGATAMILAELEYLWKS